MSEAKTKQIDFIVNWSFKGLIGITAFALAAMYNNIKEDITLIEAGNTEMRGDFKELNRDIDQIKQRLVRMETKMDDEERNRKK